MENFFYQEEINRVNEFVGKNGGYRRVGVISRSSIIELIRWLCLYSADLPGDGRTFENPSTRKLFAQAILIAGQLWSGRVYKLRISKENLPMLRQVIDDNLTSLQIHTAIGRGLSLFGRIMKERYRDMETVFCLSTGMSISDYYFCLAILLLMHLHVTPEQANSGNNGIFHIDSSFENMKPSMRELMTKFILHESQTVEGLTKSIWDNNNTSEHVSDADYYLRPLREKPILRASDGRCIVLDSRYFSCRASDGPFFILTRHFENDTNKLNILTSEFGYAFERYACDLLDSMKQTPSSVHIRRVKGHDCKNNNQTVEVADYGIIEGSDLALFELKAIIMPERLMDGEKPEQYVRFLLSKYARYSDADVKGAGQLARSIQRLRTSEWVLDRSIEQIRRIHPVLLVHDEFLEAPGHIHPLAKSFYDALKPDYIFPYQQSYAYGRFVVMPLIVISIDNLEMLQAVALDQGIIRILFDYSDYRKGRDL